MNALFTTYPISYQFMGGGHIILDEIAEAIGKKRGVSVKRYDQWNDKIENYDIVHNFDVMASSEPLVKLANSLKVPVAIHPFFTYSFDCAINEPLPISQKMKMLAYNLANRFDPLGISAVRKIMRSADILFPNSRMEADIMTRHFRIPEKNVKIVPDGIAERYFGASPKEFEKKTGLKDFVLFVGRMEPRKNILKLIAALKGTGIQLVVIGAKHPNEPYCEKCIKLADENVHFIGELKHESPMLASAYAAAKVVAFPSWDETPGLAAMEGAAAGANLVITKYGCTKDYFREYAGYVEPRDLNDIREKLIAAYEAPRNPKFAKFMRENYSWGKVADMVIEGYGQARLNRERRG